MRIWCRAAKGHRCGFCGRISVGGEPVLVYGAGTRCAGCATARYGAEVPVPFPEDVEVVPSVFQRQPEFVPVQRLASRYTSGRDRQTGEE